MFCGLAGVGFQQCLNVGLDDGWQQCFQFGIEEMRLALEGFDLGRAVSYGST